MAAYDPTFGDEAEEETLFRDLNELIVDEDFEASWSDDVWAVFRDEYFIKRFQRVSHCVANNISDKLTTLFHENVTSDAVCSALFDANDSDDEHPARDFRFKAIEGCVPLKRGFDNNLKVNGVRNENSYHHQDKQHFNPVVINQSQCSQIENVIRSFTREIDTEGRTDWKGIEQIIQNVKSGIYGTKTVGGSGFTSYKEGTRSTKDIDWRVSNPVNFSNNVRIEDYVDSNRPGSGMPNDLDVKDTDLRKRDDMGCTAVSRNISDTMSPKPSSDSSTLEPHLPSHLPNGFRRLSYKENIVHGSIRDPRLRKDTSMYSKQDQLVVNEVHGILDESSGNFRLVSRSTAFNISSKSSGSNNQVSREQNQINSPNKKEARNHVEVVKHPESLPSESSILSKRINSENDLEVSSTLGSTKDSNSSLATSSNKPKRSAIVEIQDNGNQSGNVEKIETSQVKVLPNTISKTDKSKAVDHLNVGPSSSKNSEVSKRCSDKDIKPKEKKKHEEAKKLKTAIEENVKNKDFKKVNKKHESQLQIKVATPVKPKLTEIDIFSNTKNSVPKKNNGLLSPSSLGGKEKEMQSKSDITCSVKKSIKLSESQSSKSKTTSSDKKKEKAKITTANSKEQTSCKEEHKTSQSKKDLQKNIPSEKSKHEERDSIKIIAEKQVVIKKVEKRRHSEVSGKKEKHKHSEDIKSNGVVTKEKKRRHSSDTKVIEVVQQKELSHNSVITTGDKSNELISKKLKRRTSNDAEITKEPEVNQKAVATNASTGDKSNGLISKKLKRKTSNDAEITKEPEVNQKAVATNASTGDKSNELISKKVKRRSSNDAEITKEPEVNQNAVAKNTSEDDGTTKSHEDQYTIKLDLAPFLVGRKIHVPGSTVKTAAVDRTPKPHAEESKITPDSTNLSENSKTEEIFVSSLESKAREIESAGAILQRVAIDGTEKLHGAESKSTPDSTNLSENGKTENIVVRSLESKTREIKSAGSIVNTVAVDGTPKLHSEVSKITPDSTNLSGNGESENMFVSCLESKGKETKLAPYASLNNEVINSPSVTSGSEDSCLMPFGVPSDLPLGNSNHMSLTSYKSSSISIDFTNLGGEGDIKISGFTKNIQEAFRRRKAFTKIIDEVLHRNVDNRMMFAGNESQTYFENNVKLWDRRNPEELEKRRNDENSNRELWERRQPEITSGIDTKYECIDKRQDSYELIPNKFSLDRSDGCSNYSSNLETSNPMGPAQEIVGAQDANDSVIIDEDREKEKMCSSTAVVDLISEESDAENVKSNQKTNLGKKERRKMKLDKSQRKMEKKRKKLMKMLVETCLEEGEIPPKLCQKVIMSRPKDRKKIKKKKSKLVSSEHLAARKRLSLLSEFDKEVSINTIPLKVKTKRKVIPLKVPDPPIIGPLSEALVDKANEKLKTNQENKTNISGSENNPALARSKEGIGKTPSFSKEESPKKKTPNIVPKTLLMSPKRRQNEGKETKIRKSPLKKPVVGEVHVIDSDSSNEGTKSSINDSVAEDSLLNMVWRESPSPPRRSKKPDREGKSPVNRRPKRQSPERRWKSKERRWRPSPPPKRRSRSRSPPRVKMRPSSPSRCRKKSRSRSPSPKRRSRSISPHHRSRRMSFSPRKSRSPTKRKPWSPPKEPLPLKPLPWEEIPHTSKTSHLNQYHLPYPLLPYPNPAVLPQPRPYLPNFYPAHPSPYYHY